MIPALAVDPSINLPHWGWAYVGFSLCIGVAGALAFLVLIMRLAGLPTTDALRIGQIAAMLLALPGAWLAYRMIAHPERWRNVFWLANESDTASFRWWSAASLMSWALMPFVIAAIVSGVAAILAIRPTRWLLWTRSTWIHEVLIVLAGLTGIVMAALPGIMLSATSVPVWSESSWWGLVFLLSSLSVAASVFALAALISRERLVASWCNRFDQIVIVAMLAALVVVGISLNHLGRDALVSTWGLALIIGTVVGGIVLPSFFRLPGSRMSTDIQAMMALLVVTGSVILRAAVIFAPETLT